MTTKSVTTLSEVLEYANKLCTFDVIELENVINHKYKDYFIFVPKTKQLNQVREKTEKRNQQIYKEYCAGGVKQADLALKYGINQQNVSRIIRRFRDAEQQEPLQENK